MAIIGISGYARSGKDTLAKHFEAAGYIRLGFADALKALACKLYPEIRAIVDVHGWEVAKDEFDFVRPRLQTLGTAVRETMGDDAWVHAALDQTWQHGKFVIPDTRYFSEACGIKDKGGIVIRVNRPGHKPFNDHASEIELDDWDFDYTVNNAETPEVLAVAAQDILRMEGV